MQVDKKYTTTSYKETQRLGKDFAHYLSSPRKRGSRVVAQILDSRLHGNDNRNQAIVLCLRGNLGSGKTTFLQGFAKGLGIKEKILSPTYVILKHFKIFKAPLHIKCSTAHFIYNNKYSDFYHFDCYRLKDEKDVLELGWEEIISNPKNIVAIEWPERIKKVLPKNVIKINFKFVDENKREISFKISG